MTCVLPSDQQPHSLEDIDRSIVYSEVGQLLVSVGARHSDSSTTPEAVRKRLGEEGEGDVEGEDDVEDDDIFPGGFVMDMEDEECGEDVDGGMEGGGVEGGKWREGNGCGVEEGRWDKGERCVTRKRRQKRQELNKAISSGDLSGIALIT